MSTENQDAWIAKAVVVGGVLLVLGFIFGYTIVEDAKVGARGAGRIAVAVTGAHPDEVTPEEFLAIIKANEIFLYIVAFLITIGSAVVVSFIGLLGWWVVVKTYRSLQDPEAVEKLKRGGD